MAGLARGRHFLDRRILRAGVVLGDPHHRRGQAEADQGAEVEVEHPGLRLRHQTLGDRPEEDRREDARDDHALIKRLHDPLILAHPDEEGADDRGDDRSAAEGKRVEHGVAADRLLHQHSEQHGRDHRDRIGLEQVGGHAGAVADVVADVVGDHRRIAGIVFGDAGLDLADQVGAHVGALGEDAAAQAREDRNQRAAESKTHERVHGLIAADAEGLKGRVVASGAEQPKAHHQHSGDRPAAEGHRQRRAHPFVRSLGGAYVGRAPR